MAATAFINGTMLAPDGPRTGVCLRMDGGFIQSLDRAGLQADDIVVDLEGDVLCAGFIDVQVNGGGGVLFNDAPTVETIATIGAAHARHGTTGFLPTLITDSLDVVRAAVAAVDAAITQGVPGVLGIHLEGPFLNPARKGIHDASQMVTVDEAGLEAITGLRLGKTLVTLAPELTDGATIARLADAGIVVSAGHTAASYGQMRAAIGSGLTSVTHLYNAMPQMASRQPGPIAAALESNVWCGLIVDGHHVDPAMLQLAWRAKADRRFVLVTDAMPTAGAAVDSFMLGDLLIKLEDGTLRGPDGTLAGSHLTMDQAVANARTMIGLSLEEAVRLASVEPAAMMGLSGTTGTLKAGLRADLVRLGADGSVRGTWIGGQAVYAA